MKQITLNYKDWFDKYKPIINTCLKNKEQEVEDDSKFQFGFSTEENNIIKDNIGSGKIWTVVEGDRDSIYLLSGLHRVNRLYHFITEESYNISKEEITICIDEGYPEIKQQDLDNLNLIIEKYKNEFGNNDIYNSLGKISEFVYRVGLY